MTLTHITDEVFFWPVVIVAGMALVLVVMERDRTGFWDWLRRKVRAIIHWIHKIFHKHGDGKGDNGN